MRNTHVQWNQQLTTCRSSFSYSGEIASRITGTANIRLHTRYQVLKTCTWKCKARMKSLQQIPINIPLSYHTVFKTTGMDNFFFYGNETFFRHNKYQ